MILCSRKKRKVRMIDDYSKYFLTNLVNALMNHQQYIGRVTMEVRCV